MPFPINFRCMLFALILSFGLVGLISTSGAQSTEPSPKEIYWLCKSKQQVRTVRIQIDISGICSTIYSKDGEEKIVGSGKSYISCVGFLNNIKTNLEKSNWNCRDISSTKISAALE